MGDAACLEFIETPRHRRMLADAVEALREVVVVSDRIKNATDMRLRQMHQRANRLKQEPESGSLEEAAKAQLVKDELRKDLAQHLAARVGPLAQPVEPEAAASEMSPASEQEGGRILDELVTTLRDAEAAATAEEEEVQEIADKGVCTANVSFGPQEIKKILDCFKEAHRLGRNRIGYSHDEVTICHGDGQERLPQPFLFVWPRFN